MECALTKAAAEVLNSGGFDQRLSLNDAKASALQSDAATQSYF
jgi:hypothetical protein